MCEHAALAGSLQPRVVAISAAVPEQLPAASSVAESLAGLPLPMRPVVADGGRALDGDPALPAGSPLVDCKHLHTLLELASRRR